MSKTAAEILSDFRRSDERLVNDWNAHCQWSIPSLEMRCAFLSDRLLLVASALAHVGQALIDERAADNPAAPESPKPGPTLCEKGDPEVTLTRRY